MELMEARETAAEIARLLLRGAHRIGTRRVSDQSLFGALSIIVAVTSRDYKALDPSIKELLLFGSTARNEPEPDDIDLMVLDGGFYSNVLCPERKSPGRDRYESLGDNLERMFDWFDSPEDYARVETLLEDVSVDLHVLPVTILTNDIVRHRISRQHRDPWFFENAFSTIQRFDASTISFVPVTLAELQRKYQSAAPVVAQL